MPKSYLYTGSGDKGTTSLVGGKRIAKDSVRLEAYGTLDEFSAFLGCISVDPKCNSEAKGQLAEIQNMLFNLGCYLATPIENPTDKSSVKGLTLNDIAKLESWIDVLDEQTPPIRAFILPGGSEISAKTHVARTVCRRAERRIITLNEKEYVDPNLLIYLNRLSDYLFILSRYFNFMQGIEEITWKK